MLFQIDIKQKEYDDYCDLSLRVMLFQIDIKHKYGDFKQKSLFESNVILDRYKTLKSSDMFMKWFESNVILDRYKTGKAGNSK